MCTSIGPRRRIYPVLLPFLIGFFIATHTAENPDSALSVIGSLVPLTAPMVMPVRASVAGIDLPQVILSVVLLFGAAIITIGFAAKIYRVAIFATDKKPTLREFMRWMRAT